MFTRSTRSQTIVRRTVLTALLALSLSALPGHGGASADEGAGAIFALTNATTGNAVVAYHRAADGSLEPAGPYPTGGLGTGAGLGSQNAVIVTQVAFSYDGDTVIVAERATNMISTFAVEDDQLDGPFFTPSAGPTPFGFAVGQRNTVLVSEAGAGGGASTYRVTGDGVTAVSSAIMTGPRAACWAAVTPDGRFGYVTNAGTGNISGFAIATDGSASLLDVDGVTAVTGGNPTDVAMSHDGRYLYARVANLSAIAVFRINSDGSLRALPSLIGTPAGLAGLAGF